jgi:hypothetical protein
VVATGIRVAEELEPLPDKVTPLPKKADPKGLGGTLPFSQGNKLPHVANGGSYPDPRHKYSTVRIFDEDKLDEPTFIRRNEN